MGPEETRARDALLDMQERLSRDPYDALGIIPSATPADIRNAFLSRTKQFHPARFARMSPEIQRLANEVFLLLRTAHDTIARPTTVPRTMTPGPLHRPTGGVRPAGTGANPTVRPATGTTPFASSSSSMPAAGSSTSMPAAGRPPTSPNPALRPGAQPAPARPTPSSYGGGPTQPIRGGAPNDHTATQPLRTNHDHAVTQPMRPTEHVATQPIRTDGRTPAPQLSRPGTPPPRPGTAPSTAPPMASTPIRKPGVPSTAPSPAAPADRDFAPILELIKQQQLAAARVALETLCTRQPQNLKYRALLCYARGREAQLAQRVDEARVELQDALQLDPDLQLAKTALGELFSRRR